MKRVFFCVIALLAGISTVHAQNEVSADTISPLSANVKNYDGFLLDMGMMNLKPAPFPRFTLKIPDASKDYGSIFRLQIGRAHV